MSALDKIQKSAKSIPELIFDLGELLASKNSFRDQQTCLTSFIQKNFDAQAFIQLINPPKSHFPKLSTEQFPFDPVSLFDQEGPLPQYVTLEIEHCFYIVLPLRNSSREIGKLIIRQNDPFTPQQIDAFVRISQIAGLAIFSTLQAHHQNWQKKQLELVRSVTAQISQITNLADLTQEITRLVQETFDYYYVAVFLIDSETKRLHFKASAGSDESRRPDFERDAHPGFELGEHMIGHVALIGKELVANNVLEEPRYKAVDSLIETKSEVVIPLKVENDIFGVFDIQSNQIGTFDEEDLLVLRVLADNIAIAIETTRLYQDLQLRADQLSAVSEVSRAITTTLNIDELLQRVVNLIHERFEFPFVHLYLVDPVQAKITFKAGSGEHTRVYSETGVTFDLNAEKGIIPWVVKNGKSKRIADVRSEPLFVESPVVKTPIKSEMVIPLYFGGQILGVLDIQSQVENAFDQDDQNLIETLADNIAIAIRNARLYRSERWRRQISESLRDVAGLLSENTAQADVLNAILLELKKNLPCDFAGIWLFDKALSVDTPIESQNLNLVAYLTNPDFSTHELPPIRFTPDTWVKNAINQKLPKIRQPGDTMGPVAINYQLNENYSSIAAPLHTGDEILGLLTLDHHEPRRYGAESQKITLTFASYAAIAIRNTRLYTASQEQAWISTILLEVAQATQSLTDLKTLVTTITRLTPMVVGVKGCALFLREPESQVFSLYAWYGIGDPAENLDLDSPIPLLNAPLMDELVVKREPLLVRNPKENFNLPDNFTNQLSRDTLTLVPIISRDNVLGAFLLADESVAPSPNQPHTISSDRLRIIQGIIQQTAIAVENIRLLEAKQEEAYMSTVLLQVAQASVNSIDVDDTLDSIVHILPILLGIDASVIYLWHPIEQCFRISQATTSTTAAEKDLIGTSFPPGDFPLLDVIFQNNRPLVHPLTGTQLPPEDWDLALPDEEQTDPTPILQSRYPLLMGFPLAIKDDIFGVMIAQDNSFTTNRERRFELLWGIAQQASLAIQNDHLNKEMLDRQRIEREFQLAREIQQTFLPSQVPPIPGWAMDVHWETARQVGGDFYDYFLLPDGRLALIIADVSDKGLAASLYMTVTRTLLRAAALEYSSPAETLERVNDLMLLNSQDGLFVTTFYGALSLPDGVLTYSIAGHNPPIVIQKETRKVAMLPTGGIALGALPNIRLEQKQVILNPGDCLILYTDGVTEAFNDQDQMYGDDRLKRVLKSTVGGLAEDVITTIVSDLDLFRAGAALSDDTTILAMSRTLSLANEDGNSRAAQDAVNSAAK